MSRGQFALLYTCLVGSVLACAQESRAQENSAQNNKALGRDEPAALVTGGFIQQLRALPVESVDSLRFSDARMDARTDAANEAASPISYSSVTQAQAQARANANQFHSGYRLPAQPTGRSTLQRTHESPWLERLSQGNPAQEPSTQSSPDPSPPMYRSVQGRRAMTNQWEGAPESNSAASPQLPQVLTQQQTRQGMNLSGRMPDLPQESFAPNARPALELEGIDANEEYVDIISPSVETSSKLPKRYFPKQPSLSLQSAGVTRQTPDETIQPDEAIRSSDSPSSAFTADSLQQAPRVSRVPLPRPAEKRVVETVESPAAPELPKLEARIGHLNDNATNPQPVATPKRIPAIATSASPLPGTMRISSATLQTTLNETLGQGVRVPAELSDATRTEQRSVRDQQAKSIDSEPTSSSQAGSNPAPSLSLSDNSDEDDKLQQDTVDQPEIAVGSKLSDSKLSDNGGNDSAVQSPSPMLSDPSSLGMELPNLPLPSMSISGGESVTLPGLPSLAELPSTSPPAAATIVRDGMPIASFSATPEVGKPTVDEDLTDDKTPWVSSRQFATQPSTSDRTPTPPPAMPRLMPDGLRSRAFSEQVTSPDERLRMESPHVQVSLNGPADLPIGTPAKYEIVVRNDDAIDLKGLILRLDIPAGVQVQPQRPTHGQFEVEQAADGLTMLTWGFEHLTAGKTATAPMQLVASSAKNFAVAMEWTLMPIAGASHMSVTAPRLELALEGPAEVLFAQPNVYRLHVRNPGTASANNVAVRLSAEPYGSSAAQVAHIAPGEEEVIDVELTFNERGAIQINAQAREQSGLSSETTISVLVRQPVISSQMIATESIYHGSPAECRVRLSNSGDADANNLQARMQLPRGASLISAPSGAKLTGSELNWPVGKLVAGSSEEFLVQLSLTNEGENLHQFSCSNASGLKATAEATTHVAAITDLKLFVNDPVAPAPVGGEVVYELTLTNRGTKAATNVKVVAQFSEGIEPIRGEGHSSRVVPGQTLFDSIERINAGESIKLKVVAQAAASGTHRFRVEVRSDESEVRLVQEESTQYLEGARRIATPAARSTLR